jgi:hypothetical protein
VQVTEERFLVAGEAENGQPHRHADINAGHAAIRALGKLAGIVSAFSIDHRAVGETAVVHDR